MSMENFVEFQKDLSTDPALAEKIQALRSEPWEVAVTDNLTKQTITPTEEFTVNPSPAKAK